MLRGALALQGCATKKRFARNRRTGRTRPGDDRIPAAKVYSIVKPRQGSSRASPQTSSRRRRRLKSTAEYVLVKKGLECLKSLTTSCTAKCGKYVKLMAIIADPCVLLAAYVRLVSISRSPLLGSQVSPALLDIFARRRFARSLSRRQEATRVLRTTSGLPLGLGRGCAPAPSGRPAKRQVRAPE